MQYKVLIMDNDANSLFSLQNKFISEGFVVIIHNGLGNLENLKQFINSLKLDLIISELNFTNIDPFELFNFIKSEPSLAQTPIFIYTFQNQTLLKDKCRNLGINYFYSKNELNLDEFIEKVKKTLSNLKNFKNKN